MAFTYNDSLATDRDLVRFHLGDVVDSSGPRPGGRNFSDREIAYNLTTVTGTNGWRLIVGRLLIVLSNEWAQHARNITIGEYREDATKTGETFKQRADDWWATIDSSGALIEQQLGASVVAVTRQDAYSSTIAANTVTPSTS